MKWIAISLATLLLFLPASAMPQPSAGGNLKVNVVNKESEAVPVKLQDSASVVEYRYIGLTEIFETDGQIELEGARSVAAMHKACAAEFGSGARGATIQEAYFRDDEDTRSGWLAPGGEMLITTHGGQHFAHDAASGIQTSVGNENPTLTIGRAYCVRYIIGAEDFRAPTSAPGGLISASFCDAVLPVACSAPVTVPVAP